MTQKAFDKIAEGLNDALAIARARQRSAAARKGARTRKLMKAMRLQASTGEKGSDKPVSNTVALVAPHTGRGR